MENFAQYFAKDSECVTGGLFKDASLFIQVSCGSNSNLQRGTNQLGLLHVTIGILMCITFTIMVLIVH